MLEKNTGSHNHVLKCWKGHGIPAPYLKGQVQYGLNDGKNT